MNPLKMQHYLFFRNFPTFPNSIIQKLQNHFHKKTIFYKFFPHYKTTSPFFTMSLLQLKDFAFSYPELEQFPNITSLQEDVANRYELREESSSSCPIRQDSIPESGQRLYHQVTTFRYTIFQDKMFIFHETGTGKTCISVSIAEAYRLGRTFTDKGVVKGPDFVDSFLSSHPSHIKKCIILVRNTALIDEFQRQIVDKCTDPSTYRDLYSIRTADPKLRMRRIRKALDDQNFYKFYTYSIFFNKNRQLLGNPEGLKKEFSNTLFILDEVHNLFHTGETGRDTAGPEDDREVGADEDYDVEVDKGAEDAEAKEAQGTTNANKYEILREIFAYAEKYSLLLMTATPMTNSKTEFLHLMGLLYPEKKVLYPSVGKTLNLASMNANIEEIKRDMIGKVSFFKAPDDVDVEIVVNKRLPVVLPLQGDETLPGVPEEFRADVQKYAGVYALEMNEYQSEQYTLEQAHPMLSTKGKKIPFHLSLRKIANAVYPKDASGNLTKHSDFFTSRPSATTGLREFISKEARDRFNKLVVSPQEADGRFSIKLKAMIDICRNLLTDGEKELLDRMKWVRDPRGLGKTFIYFQFITSMGLDFFIHTLTEVHANPWAGERKRRKFILYDFEKNLKLQPLISEHLEFLETNKEDDYCRVAILTGKTVRQHHVFSEILKLYNHPDNWDGRLIRVLAATPTAREGLTILDVSNVLTVGANWTIFTAYQVRSRSFRIGSHANILQKWKNQTVKELDTLIKDSQMLPKTDAKTTGEIIHNDRVSGVSKFWAKIYNLAAVPMHRSPTDLCMNSIDIYVYDMAETKGYTIREFEKIIKEQAFDYRIHFKHNSNLERRNMIMGFNFPLTPPPPLIPTEYLTDRSAYRALYSGDNSGRLFTFLKSLIFKDNKRIIRMSELQGLCGITKENLVPSLLRILKGESWFVVSGEIEKKFKDFGAYIDGNFLLVGEPKQPLTLSSAFYKQIELLEMSDSFSKIIHIAEAAAGASGKEGNVIDRLLLDSSTFLRNSQEVIKQLKQMRISESAAFMCVIEIIIHGGMMKTPPVSKEEMINLFYPRGIHDDYSVREIFVRFYLESGFRYLHESPHLKGFFDLILDSFKMDIFRFRAENGSNIIVHTFTPLPPVSAAICAYLTSANKNYSIRFLRDGKWEMTEDKADFDSIRQHRVRIIYDMMVSKDVMLLLWIYGDEIRVLDWREYDMEYLNAWNDNHKRQYGSILEFLQNEGRINKGTVCGTGKNTLPALKAQVIETYRGVARGKETDGAIETFLDTIYSPSDPKRFAYRAKHITGLSYWASEFVYGKIQYHTKDLCVILNEQMKELGMVYNQ